MPQRPSNGVWFAPPPPEAPPPPTPEEIAKQKEEKKKSRQKFRNDPKLVAAARELRDRYIEQFNASGMLLPPSACGKYDVSRQLEAVPSAMKIESLPGAGVNAGGGCSKRREAAALAPHQALTMACRSPDTDT